MLRNLLSNAIKFTPAGGSVRIAAARAADDWQLTVADTGRGLPAATPAKHCAPKSWSAGPARPARPAAPGLGLKLSSDVAARNGGQLWVESAVPGQGTVFTLVIPAAQEPPVAV